MGRQSEHSRFGEAVRAAAGRGRRRRSGRLLFRLSRIRVLERVQLARRRGVAEECAQSQHGQELELHVLPHAISPSGRFKTAYRPARNIKYIDAISASGVQPIRALGRSCRTSVRLLNFTFKFNQGTGRRIMEKVSLLEFRRHAVAVIRKVRQGKRLIMTYRGAPVMRLEPIGPDAPGADDPFYKIAQLATAEGRPLTNEEIDQAVYES